MSRPVEVREPALSWKGRVLLGAFGVLLAFGTAEGALRAARFHFDLVPALQFGWPDPVALRDAYTPDVDLVWVTRDYRVSLRAARRAHPAIVFMGDSCTEFGTYPARTIEKLRAAGSDLSTGAKLGVGGWSTQQGLTQLRRDVIPMHPRVITEYYGWNDHWVALGLTDPEIARAHRLRGLAEHLRLAQLWLKVKVNMAARRKPAPNRVPLPEYAENLRLIAMEARAAGIVPMFVTAPSNHVPGHEPQYLAARHLRALSELVPLHAAYVGETRRIGRETGTPVCDAAAAFAALPEPHERFFQKDGIHLTSAGDEEMARVLSTCLLALR
ncbi:MAG TPA: GDSL-type esterase/lipase family protein [Vicinamibacterales bacterium]|nr:GDSL-type esterase/lipase family protein [Vicinamibacterales bacterium]